MLFSTGLPENACRFRLDYAGWISAGLVLIWVVSLHAGYVSVLVNFVLVKFCASL